MNATTSLKVTEKDYISLRQLKAIKKQVHDKRIKEFKRENEIKRSLGKKMICN